MSAKEATRQVRNDLYTYDPSKDGVRYAPVDCLLAAGFTVYPDPYPERPDHSSVEWRGTWDDDVSEQFDECFEEPIFSEADQ